MAKVVVYGLKNCSSVKKAVKFYQDKGDEVKLHDYDADGLNERIVKNIFATNGAKLAINTRGPSFRNLDDDTKAVLTVLINEDAHEVPAGALELILNNNRILKRPVVRRGCTSKYKVEDVKTYKSAE